MTDRTTTTEPQTDTGGGSGYPLPLAPGERPVLFTHEQYRRARKGTIDLEEFDILMRRPDADDSSPEQAADEDARWRQIPAKKYLKHRAIEWHEAATIEELPERWQDRARSLDAAFADEAELDRRSAEDA